jgi:oligopeptide/dipeptide ABC transporter ATP-binding protein
MPSPINPPSGCPFHTRCNLVEDICRTALPPIMTWPDRGSVACHISNRALPSLSKD